MLQRSTKYCAKCVILIIAWFVALNAYAVDTNQIMRLISEDVVTVDDLYKYLEGVDNSSELSNVFSILVRVHDQEIYNLLEKLWNLDKKGADSLNWKLISEVSSRVSLAQTLAQISTRNDYAQYHDFIVNKINDKNKRVQINSIIALGIIGCDSDLDNLIAIVNTGNSSAAVSSVYAISFIGTNRARETLEFLVQNNRVKADQRILYAVHNAIAEFQSIGFEACADGSKGVQIER